MQRKVTLDMTGDAIPKLLFRFSMPMMAISVLQQMYNVLDSIVVGQAVGSNALAGISVIATLSSLLLNFFIGVFSGASVVAAQACGARNKTILQKAATSTLLLALIFGAGVSVVGVAFLEQFLLLLRTPDTVIPFAVKYGIIYFSGTVFITVYNAAAGILRSIGDINAPLYYLVVSIVMNLALNLFTVFILRMGISGVALATVLSQAVCAVLTVFRLKSRGLLSLRFALLKNALSVLIEILKIGIPCGLQNSLTAISNIILQLRINFFGASAIAGLAVASRFAGFLDIPSGAIGMTLTIFVAQNIAKKQQERVRHATTFSVLSSLCITAILSGACVVFWKPLTFAITTDAAVLPYARDAILFKCGFLFLYSFIACLQGAMRGMGNTLVPTIISLLSICVFRILFIEMILPHWNSLYVILICYPFSWALASAFLLIYYRTGKWKEKL